MPLAKAGGALRILIADDYARTRALLRAELEGAGFDVCAEAATGSEAVNGAIRERPDVCLLDVVMPDGDGILAAAEIRRALPETKIVLMTAVPDEEGLVSAARAGADGYVSKVVDPLRMAEVIRAVAEGEYAYPRRLVTRGLAGLANARQAP